MSAGPPSSLLGSDTRSPAQAAESLEHAAAIVEVEQAAIARRAELEQATRSFVAKASSEGTRASYRKHWQMFEAWCREESRIALPALATTIADYLSDRALRGARGRAWKPATLPIERPVATSSSGRPRRASGAA